MTQKPFISCDWGTSAFRLRWVNPDLSIQKEVRTPAGCKSLFQQASDPASRSSLFENVLRQHLAKIQPRADEQVPLVISGMASSTIGWRELPYLRDPLKSDGSNLLWDNLIWDGPPWLASTLLVSGVTLNDDIIRGEETEAIGILSALRRSDGVLILPGTHSKHLVFENGVLTNLTTFMTGELFEVLCDHTVLSASVARSTSSPSTAFEQGVATAQKSSLSQSLFKVRTRAVLHRQPPPENASFLSGLLIGAELCATTTCKSSLWVGGSDQLRELYLRAASVLNLPFTPIPQGLISQAVVRGQAMLLKRLFPESFA